MRTATNDTSRPIPQNNAIDIEGPLSDFSDEVTVVRIGDEMRTAFGMSDLQINK
jgi:hypothetical protein